jgi:hypothetical protein
VEIVAVPGEMAQTRTRMVDCFIEFPHRQAGQFGQFDGRVKRLFGQAQNALALFFIEFKANPGILWGL